MVDSPSATPLWQAAWDEALYGARGFFRTHRPAAHFRTSVHASPEYAEALVRLAHEHRLTSVVDVGAGGGELLSGIHAVDPTLRLHGVEVASPPAALPDAVTWSAGLPERLDGLVIANEWLDNVPCPVVEVDDRGVSRLVHVDPGTGRERLGDRPPERLASWLGTWWPLDAEPGRRAEVGLPRDAAWRSLVSRTTGLAVAVDYGHTRDQRPLFGTLRSYRDGHEVDVRPDGARDVTAHVAVDSVAAAVSGRLTRQRDALGDLGVSGRRPDLALATEDPAAYLRALGTAAGAAELVAQGGLGDFWWIISG